MKLRVKFGTWEMHLISGRKLECLPSCVVQEKTIREAERSLNEMLARDRGRQDRRFRRYQEQYGGWVSGGV